MQLKVGVTRSLCLTAVLVLTMLLAVACGGDDGADGSGTTGSPEDRLAEIEARMAGFEQYIAAQVQLQQQGQGQQVVVEIGEEGEEIVSTTAFIAPPLYSLRRQDSTENEQEIVLWMADCAARTYLNPELPEEVVNYEIEKTQERMWAAIEGGQYSSFEDYIGQSFKFCRAEIVEEESVE